MWAVITAAVVIGLLLFVVDLGSIGLVDETPPLFAASARAMARSGDWLIPQVNGLPRYDKPPLVYWLMAASYSLPGHASWDPLGSWAAALPSALASTAVVALLALLLAWWERRFLPRPLGLWLPAGLCFALSPLVMVWSRIGVSDSLLTALVALAMISSWWRLVNPRIPWWLCWLALGLATLTKGPVAVALFAITWGLFAFPQRQGALLRERLQPCRGVLLTLVVAAPWYGAAALREGQPFLQSFFGYHNLQRFTEVVNRHQSPWWFYGALLLVASLPSSPLLLLGLWRALVASPSSLARFAACWLLAVLLLFSLSATKLPSYWLPATPAAAILAALALAKVNRLTRLALRLSALLALGCAALLAATPLWLPAIGDPDLSALPLLVERSALVPAAVLLLLAGALTALWWSRPAARCSAVEPLVALQLSWLLLLPAVFWPLLRLGDSLRSQPIRALALQSRQLQPSGRPIAMLGVIRPSFHFYAEAPVAYEGTSAQALVNLSDRLQVDPRVRASRDQARILVAAPLTLAERKHWAALLSPLIQRQGRYGLWWLDLQRLEQLARALQQRQGLQPSWSAPRPERF